MNQCFHRYMMIRYISLKQQMRIFFLTNFLQNRYCFPNFPIRIVIALNLFASFFLLVDDFFFCTALPIVITSPTFAHFTSFSLKLVKQENKFWKHFFWLSYMKGKKSGGKQLKKFKHFSVNYVKFIVYICSPTRY